MFVDDFLTIGYGLAVLSYFLGALFYSLPFPLRSIKKWGVLLVQDGLLSALLILLFNFIVNTVRYLQNILGVNIDNYFAYMYGLEQSLMDVFITIRLLTKALGVKGIGVISSLVSPFTGILVIAISSIALILVISTIVIEKTGLLIALGSMLYAIPFRIGRNAGASLIAFAIVGSLAFPLLPNWISLLLQDTSFPHITPRGIVFVSGHVKGDVGAPYTGVIIFHSESSGKDYKFVIRQNGYYNAGKPDKGLPENETFSLRVEYLGIKLITSPDRIHVPQDLRYNYIDPSADYQLDVKVEGIFPYNTFLLKIKGCLKFKTERRANTTYVVKCDTYLHQQIRVDIYAQRSCLPRLTRTINLSSVSFSLQNYTWHDVPASHGLLTGLANASSIEIIYKVPSDCSIVYPNIAESKYTRELTSSLLMATISYFWNWIAMTVAILSYLTIVSMLTYGLAIALGGWRPRLPMPFL